MSSSITDSNSNTPPISDYDRNAQRRGAFKPVLSKEDLRSFGRTQGRALTPGQKERILALLPKVAFSLEHAVDPGKAFEDSMPNIEKLHLEIGFGDGRHLAYQAELHPEIAFIGCEPFTNGMSKLLGDIEEKGLRNIRIFHGDARVLMRELPNGCMAHTDVLFPDPWPKVRQHKKRLVTAEFLSYIHRITRKEGTLRIATDHNGYEEWIDEKLEDHPLWDYAMVTFPPEEWITTKYQHRAIKLGDDAVFFEAQAL